MLSVHRVCVLWNSSFCLGVGLVVSYLLCSDVFTCPGDNMEQVVGSATRLLAYLSFSCVAQYSHSTNTTGVAGAEGNKLALSEHLLAM